MCGRNLDQGRNSGVQLLTLGVGDAMRRLPIRAGRLTLGGYPLPQGRKGGRGGGGSTRTFRASLIFDR